MKSVSKIMIISYTVPEIWHTTDVIVIFHFGLFFALLPPNRPNEKFKKMKKTMGDMIILYKCTKNHDHITRFEMVCDRCNCYFSNWTIFCPFNCLIAPKMKMSKKWKKCLEISSSFTSVPKIMIMCYTVPEIWHVTHEIIFHFGLSLPFYPPNSPKKQNV